MRLLLAVGLALDLAAAVNDGPVASFETEPEQPFRALGGAVAERVREHATAGEFALRVDIKGGPQDTWPGILLTATDPDWSKLDLLEFDAFVAGDQPVQLGVRLDTLDGRGFFGSTRLKAGANKRAAVNVKGFSGEADLTRVKSLLIYVSKPRVDSRIFFDAFAWGRFSARFRKFVHVDPGPGLTPSADEQRRGFQVEPASPLRLVFPDTLPRRRATGLTLAACRGETGSVALAVHALRELLEVRVEAGELRLPGATLPAASLSVGTVRHLSKRWYYSADWYLTEVPSYVADQPTLALPAGRTGTFHLSFSAPPDARPGVYRGNVTIRAGSASQVLPLAVRVLPFTLPEAKGLFYGEYYRPSGRPADARAQIRADLADMRAMGMTTVGLCFGVEAASYKVADGAVTFDFQGGTRFEWFMEAYRELGFPAPVVLLSDSGQDAAGQVGKLGESAYEQVYVAFHRALAEICKQKGWPSLYVQPVDEPGWQGAPERERNVALLKLLKAAGMPTEQDGPGDDYFHNQAGPFADVWNYNGAVGRPAVVDAALREGHLITLYNNDVESFRPEADRWAYGFYNWRHGLHGGFNWEYRGGAGSLYDNNDAEHGDWVHRYLPEGGEPGGPSTGWLASRAGVADRRYLLLLEGLIARGKARGGGAKTAAATAQAVLDNLRARLDPRRDVRGLASFDALLPAAQAKAQGYALPPDAAGCAVGDLKQPNGLTFDEYDTLRWLVASQALAVAAALGEAGPPKVAAWRPAAVRERLSVVARGPGGGVESLPRPNVKLPDLAAAPALDGVLDGDPGWAGASEVGLTRSDGAGAPEMPTRVRAGLHGGRLYVAFDCAEDRLNAIQAHIREPDGNVWEDDCVELFLDPGCTGKRYWQVTVNSLGTVARLAPGGAKWDAEVTAAAKVEPERKRWRVELAVPLGELKLAPRCGLNFGRERRPLEVLELSTWSVTGGEFGKPERFGYGVVTGVAPLPPAVEPEIRLSLSPSWMTLAETDTELSLQLQVPAEAAERAAVVVKVEGAGKRVEARLPGRAAERIKVRLAVGDLPAGRYAVTASLLGAGRPAEAHAVLTRLPGLADGE